MPAPTLPLPLDVRLMNVTATLLLGLVANYAGFIAPQAAAFSNIALMLAILLWRPQGLYPVAQR